MDILISDYILLDITISIIGINYSLFYCNCRYDEAIYSILHNNYNKRIDSICIFDKMSYECTDVYIKDLVIASDYILFHIKFKDKVIIDSKVKYRELELNKLYNGNKN